ncbi:MAG: putative 2-aminoethylphosphonate ABC transporter permease subunit [Geminicoccaceae bacterium]|nr:putative 2-aminoethylphosphonate ABC transporter permease subunit [Geminicoccaceae bacterium]
MASPRALAAPLPASARPVRQALAFDERVMRAGLLLLLLYLAITVVLPLWALFAKAFEGPEGGFAGLANFAAYAATPALTSSLRNALVVATLSTAICIALAFGYAYALTRTCLPGKSLFAAVATVPLLAPSLLPAIALVYLFGNQGLARWALFGHSIYGPIGIVIGEVFWTFPHALIILTTALSTADARLYEAALALKASPARIFFTVTLPAVRYGLISATFVVFTLVITDFGVPKVIGGSYNVLALDVYKHVVGQQNFRMGAVVGMILLVPAVLSFVVDRFAQKRQAALLSARAVPYVPKPDPLVDGAAFVFCALVACAILSILGVAVFASFVNFWPYDLSFSLKNYDFDNMDGGGWESYRNSLEMATLTAVFGTALVFTGAWLVEKTRAFVWVRGLAHLAALLPLAVPGLVMGIGYVFFFVEPSNPFHFLYGSMAILVVCTIAHFYSVAHLAAVTALKQLDPEFEAVSASLKVPLYRTFLKVTVPVCLPAVLDIAAYFFVNAMTTVSAVVFLYSPRTQLASIAVLNMDDAGDIAPAAAMAVLIFATSALVRGAYALLVRRLLARTQAWRSR